MDHYDHQILQALQKNSRISNLRLAEKINLSAAACLRRLQALEKKGIIKHYTVVLDEQRIGSGTQVLTSVTLNGQDSQKLAEFEAAVAKIANVLACYLVSGHYDYLIRLAVNNIQDYERLHQSQLSKLPHVARMESNFAIREVVWRANYLPESR